MKILMLLEGNFPPDVRVEKEIKTLIAKNYEVVLACSSPQTQSEIIEWSGATIIKKKMPKLIYKSSIAALKISLYFSFWHKFISQIFSEYKINVIHLHDLPLAKVAVRFSQNHHTKFILDLHENWPALLKVSQHTNTFPGKILYNEERWKEYEKLYAKKADKILVVVKEAKKRMELIGISEEKIQIVSNTIDAEDTNFPKILKTKNTFSIIYAGGLTEHRGIQVALDAVNIIKNVIPNIKFRIIGDGRYKKELQKKAAKLKIKQNVLFTGWLQFEEMLNHLTESDIAIIPHLKNEHTDTTIPHKLFQYFAAGKPVISSDCIPLKRIITQTRTGIVYKHDDPVELANSIQTLSEKSELYKEFQRNEKKALIKYNWSLDSRRLLQVYSDIRK